MKNILIIILFLAVNYFIFTDEIKYPFLYIPGMFDNGDMLTKDSLLVKNMNNEDGFYYRNYFNNTYSYDKEPVVCSSNIVGSKYNRLIVANVIAEYRTNIAIELMAERLFCLINGRAPIYKNYNSITRFKGNDFNGMVIRDNINIYFQGLLEEMWVKYGKKVYYRISKNKNRVLLDKKSESFYINPDGYFDDYEEIKFNVVAHSSGGLAIREFIRLQSKENLIIPVNTIINLSVPQKGARLVLDLNNNFSQLIRTGIFKFYSNIETGFIEIKDNGYNLKFTYKDLESRTRIDLLKDNNFISDIFIDVLSAYILYFIPFDGRKRVLGNDPALYDLNPEHRFVKLLNKTPIPDNIKIYNYRVKSPYAKIFELLAQCSNLGESDGVVDYLDTSLDNIPNYKNLTIHDTVIYKANHIPMPYIKPLFELKDTVKKNYGILRLLLKVNKGKEENINIICALFYSIFKEMDFDPEDFMKNKNFSVIDYFAENPVEF